MTNLEEKLKEYGFPKPVKIKERYSNGYPAKCKIQYNSQSYFEITMGDAAYFYYWIEQIKGYPIEHACMLAQELKTDSDWLIVANFIKFLKGE